MKLVLAFAALAASLAAIGPAVADAPPAGFARHPVAAHRAPPRAYHTPARRYGYAPHRRHVGPGYRVAGPALGPMPNFYASTGHAAAHLEEAPVGLTLYREAYIGRGLIYNTPPTLDRPATVLSVRY